MNYIPTFESFIRENENQKLLISLSVDTVKSVEKDLKKNAVKYEKIAPTKFLIEDTPKTKMIIKMAKERFGSQSILVTVQESSLTEGKNSFYDKLKTVLTYKDLKGNSSIEVKEVEGQGMAGEPFTFSYIFLDGKISSLKDVKKYMNAKDFKDLSDYIKDVSTNNYDSAISYVI